MFLYLVIQNVLPLASFFVKSTPRYSVVLPTVVSSAISKLRQNLFRPHPYYSLYNDTISRIDTDSEPHLGQLPGENTCLPLRCRSEFILKFV